MFERSLHEDHLRQRRNKKRAVPTERLFLAKRDKILVEFENRILASTFLTCLTGNGAALIAPA